MRKTTAKERNERRATDQWVRRLNKLARRMDETADSVHPSAIADQTAEDRAEWKRIAARGPRA